MSVQSFIKTTVLPLFVTVAEPTTDDLAAIEAEAQDDSLPFEIGDVVLVNRRAVGIVTGVALEWNAGMADYDWMYSVVYRNRPGDFERQAQFRVNQLDMLRSWQQSCADAQAGRLGTNTEAALRRWVYGQQVDVCRENESAFA